MAKDRFIVGWLQFEVHTIHTTAHSTKERIKNTMNEISCQLPSFHLNKRHNKNTTKDLKRCQVIFDNKFGLLCCSATVITAVYRPDGARPQATLWSLLTPQRGAAALPVSFCGF